MKRALLFIATLLLGLENTVHASARDDMFELAHTPTQASEKVKQLSLKEKEWLKFYLDLRSKDQKLTTTQRAQALEVAQLVAEHTRSRLRTIGASVLVATLLVSITLVFGVMCASLLKHTIALFAYGIGAALTFVVGLLLAYYLLKDLGWGGEGKNSRFGIFRSLLGRLFRRTSTGTPAVKLQKNILQRMRDSLMNEFN